MIVCSLASGESMAADLSRVPAEVRERIKELEEELKEGEQPSAWVSQHIVIYMYVVCTDSV